MAYGKIIDEFYNNNESLFDRLFDFLSSVYCIDKDVFVLHSKRLLLDIIDKKGKLSFMSVARGGFKPFLKYYISLLYYAVMSIFGAKNIVKENYDAVFDIWSHGVFDRFYCEIYSDIKDRMNTQLISFEANFETDGLSCKSYYTHYLIHSGVARVIFNGLLGRFNELEKICTSYNFDAISFVLHMIREIAIYESQSMHINARCLITANDNGMTSLRKFIYNKNIHCKVFVIQNSARGAGESASGDIFNTGDIFACFGPAQLEKMYGCRYEEVVFIGSLCATREINYIANNCIKYDNEFDVVFIEQIADYDMDENYYVASYEASLQNLIRFADENPDVKVAYRIRPNRINDRLYSKEYVKRIDDMLCSSSVIIDNLSRNSYVSILKSKVVVTYNSTMGFEALKLGRRSLYCNYDKFSFWYSDTDELGSLTDSSYSAFSDRLKFLITDESSETDKYFNDKAIAMLSDVSNPFKVVSNKIMNLVFC